MYIIDFDIVAICLSAIAICLFHIQKRILDTSNRLFAILGWTILGSSIFGTASSALINTLPSLTQIPIITTNTVYYFFHNSIPALVFFYILSICGYPRKRNITIVFFTIPWIICIVMIILNLFTPVLFFIDGDALYQHGIFLNILYFIGLFYFLSILVMMIFGKTRLTVAKRFSFFPIFILPILAIIIQYYIPGMMLECFSASLSLLFILLTIQNINDLIDNQTGMYNNQMFIKLLGEYHVKKSTFSLIVVHIIQFAYYQSLINMQDYSGLLRNFSNWLMNISGKNTNACILEDGLFAVLIDEKTSQHSDGELALAILERSARAWELGSQSIELPIRIGIFRFAGNTYKVSEILDLVDQLAAMPGEIGNRHIFYENDFIPNKHRHEAAIAYALKDHIKRKSIDFRYQPVYSAKENRIIALEILTGLQMKDGEFVKQSMVIKIAERLGLSFELSEMVFRHSFQWYTENNLEQKGINQLQIRLFESFCLERDWNQIIIRMAKEYDMPLSNICLEITETSVVNTGEHLLSNMHALAGQGVKFALDDFGSGYTDLGQILQMPFSIIKLDKKMMYSGLQTVKGEKLLSGSIMLFKDLNRTIVAEGIESLEQSLKLKNMGCDLLQGYFYGHPLEEDEIFNLLR